MRSDSGWFLGGFGVVGHLGTRFARQKLGKKKHTPTMGKTQNTTLIIDTTTNCCLPEGMVPYEQARR
jgi:hypothetical protein